MHLRRTADRHQVGLDRRRFLAATNLFNLNWIEFGGPGVGIA
jgi:hypothetical protein